MSLSLEFSGVRSGRVFLPFSFLEYIGQKADCSFGRNICTTHSYGTGDLKDEVKEFLLWSPVAWLDGVSVWVFKVFKI